MSLNKFLQKIGVSTIYFGSGARNEMLLDYFQKSDFDIIQGYDERSLAFQALGSSKALGEPVAVCTTSGTAVSEALNAVIEAYFSGERLVLISCDRPLSLSETFAPQTIDQSRLMRSYARTFIELEFDNEKGTEWEYGQSSEHSSEQILSKTEVNYPLAINIRVNRNEPNENTVSYSKLSHKAFHEISEKTLFIFNDHQFINTSIYAELFNEVKSRNLMFYQEVESPFYASNLNPSEILYDEVCQQKLESNEIDFIIRVGKCPNSKFWRLLHQYSTDVIHLDPFGKPCHTFGKSLLLEDKTHNSAVKNLITTLKEKGIVRSILQDSNWDLINLVDKILLPLDKSEISYIKKIFSHKNFQKIYLGNSMAIRYAKFFKREGIIANRGANGIDGLISSAIGYTHASCDPVALILGDLSALYDLNTLAYEIPDNLFIFILNNYGGQIFDRIGLDHVKNEHDLSFEKLLSGFPHKVLRLNSSQNEINLNKYRVFECHVSNHENKLFWRKFYDEIS